MIFVLTGPVHSGKTTLCRHVVTELKKHRIRVGGFLSLAVQKEERRIGYDLWDIEKATSRPFIRETGEDHWERIGRYFFIPEALKTAREMIKCIPKAGLFIVDEVGPLELSGRGFWPALEEAVASPEPNFLLVARASVLKELIKRLQGNPLKAYDIKDKAAVRSLLEDLLAHPTP